MHVLILLALQTLAPATDTTRDARASIRIVRAGRATAADWAGSEQRYERIIEENGRRMRLRLVEFE